MLERPDTSGGTGFREGENRMRGAARASDSPPEKQYSAIVLSPGLPSWQMWSLLRGTLLDLTKKWTHGICLSPSDLRHLAVYPPGPSMLSQGARSRYFMAEQYSRAWWCIDLYSPADGPLGYSHILATVNYATINTGMHTPFQIIFCFGGLNTQ